MDDKIFDSSIKSLFNISKKPLIKSLSAIFGISIPMNVKIQRTNGEFINRIVGNTEGDYFIKLEGSDETYHFHIEFQSDGDSNMALRMFLYGYNYADMSRTKENIYDSIELNFPTQKVIYLDKDERIKDTLMVKFNFKDRDPMVYKVGVLKLDDYELVDLVKEEMYNLIPFKVIKVRKTFGNIVRRKISEEKKTALINEQYKNLENIMKEITDIMNELKDNQEISLLDYETFMLEATNLMEYFYAMYDKYINYEYIAEEVRNVVKSVVDPKLKEAYLKAEEKLENVEIEKDKALSASRNLLHTLLGYKFNILSDSIKDKITLLNGDKLTLITAKINEIKTLEELEALLS